MAVGLVVVILAGLAVVGVVAAIVVAIGLNRR